MRRRSLLASVGGVVAASCAGCTGRGGRSLSLGRFEVLNVSPEPHRFRLRVNRDGNRVHDSRHRLRGKEDSTVHSAGADCTWDDREARYTVAVSVDSGPFVEQSVSGSEFASSNPGVGCVAVEALFYGDEDDGFTFVVLECSRTESGCGFATAEDTPGV